MALRASPDDGFERAKEIALASLLAETQELIKGMVCAKHGEPATLTIEGDSVIVSGCCMPFRKRIYEVISFK